MATSASPKAGNGCGSRSEHLMALCYHRRMDTTIRNLDEQTYRALKARAALAGKTVGEVLDEAIRLYLARPELPVSRGSLRAPHRKTIRRATSGSASRST